MRKCENSTLPNAKISKWYVDVWASIPLALKKIRNIVTIKRKTIVKQWGNYTPSGISIQAKGIEPDIIVEAGITELTKETPENRREENLRGALDKKEKDKKDSANKPELTPVEKLLQDDQISRAVDLIRGINLFSNNKKITSTAKVFKKLIHNKVSSISNWI